MTSPRLFWPWVAVALVLCAAMWFMPGSETVPYHFAWISLVVVYGIVPWPRAWAYSALVGLTVVSGVVLVVRAAQEVIAADELTEIPLMALLMTLTVLHVRRRHDALGQLGEVHARDRARSEQQLRLSRMTSHEMRTPTTIAIGYVELLISDETDPERRADLHVVLDELGRVRMNTERLVRAMALPQQDRLEPVDVDAFLLDLADRWRVVAPRDWRVLSDGGVQLGSPDRMRSCLDTVIENAVRYSAPGDPIRLFSHVDDGMLVMGVADAGPGFSAPASGNEGVGSDDRSQTGFGLALVREAVEQRGGRVEIGRSVEGGAEVRMLIPVRTRARSRPLDVSPMTGS